MANSVILHSFNTLLKGVGKFIRHVRRKVEDGLKLLLNSGNLIYEMLFTNWGGGGGWGVCLFLCVKTFDLCVDPR